MKTVKQVLDTKGYEFHSITPTASVYDALQKMAQQEQSSTPWENLAKGATRLFDLQA